MAAIQIRDLGAEFSWGSCVSGLDCDNIDTDALHADGLLTEKQLAEVHDLQKKQGGRILKLLVEKQFVTDQDMSRHHQRLRARFAFCKAAFYEQLIQAYFWDSHIANGPSAMAHD